MSTQRVEAGANYNYDVRSDLKIAEIKQHWMALERLIGKALDAVPDPKPESMDDIMGKIITGNYLPLVIMHDDRVEGLVVLSINRYRQIIALCINYLAGENLIAWANLAMARIEQIGRKYLVHRIETVTHSSLVKLLKNRYGFDERSFLTKDLSYG